MPALCLSCLISSLQPTSALCSAIIFILLISKLRPKEVGGLEVKKGHTTLKRQIEDINPGLSAATANSFTHQTASILSLGSFLPAVESDQQGRFLL